MTAEEMKAAESGAQSAPLPLEGVDISPKQDEGVLKVRAAAQAAGGRLHRPPGPGCVVRGWKGRHTFAGGGLGARASPRAFSGPLGHPRSGGGPGPLAPAAPGPGTAAPTPACAVQRGGRGGAAPQHASCS